MGKIICASEENKQLADLIERVIAGESIVIARNGKPVAELVPYSSSKLVLGAYHDEMSGWRNVNLDGINWPEEFPEWKQSPRGPIFDETGH